MAGFPGETLSQMKETIDMAKNKLRLVYNPNSPPTPKN